MLGSPNASTIDFDFKELDVTDIMKQWTGNDPTIVEQVFHWSDTMLARKLIYEDDVSYRLSFNFRKLTGTLYEIEFSLPNSLSANADMYQPSGIDYISGATVGSALSFMKEFYGHDYSTYENNAGTIRFYQYAKYGVEFAFRTNVNSNAMYSFNIFPPITD